MIRVRFLQNYKNYKADEVVTLSPNEAFGAIDAGYAVVSKDMVASDYKTSQAQSVKVWEAPNKTKTNKKRR